MSRERPLRRLFFRWTAPKGFAAVASFLGLTLLVEYLLVYSFLSLGLTDKNLLQISLTSPAFIVTISPLFHLIPIGVILVLASSWVYLVKQVAVIPRRREPIKKAPTAPRKRSLGGASGRRFKALRRLSKRLSKRFQRISRTLSGFYRRMGAAALRIRGISYMAQRLHFARATVKSAVNILGIFLAAAIAMYLLGNPGYIKDLVVGFYAGNPSFLDFILKIMGGAQAIAQALAPLGWVASALNKALLAAAPGFRNALLALGSPIVNSMVSLDLAGKYLVCQNAAAWASAMTALAYGRYVSSLYRGPKR